MSSFSFSAPTQVRFGWGERSVVPRTLHAGTWGVLCTSTMQQRPMLQSVWKELGSRRIRVVWLGGVTPNPRISEIERIIEQLNAESIDGILAVGGGSILDAAKLARVAYAHRVTARALLDDMASMTTGAPGRRCRLVVIPTTAGTGAEVSKGAIVTDDVRDGRLFARKVAARGDAMIPDEAIIDPELTVSVPPRTTAETGFDVIAHAVETYLSAAATPVTDVLALAALEHVPPALLSAMRKADDREARSGLSLYSWLMGYNLAHATTCLPHRMQYPIGSLTDTSHQIGLAALYVPWVRAVSRAGSERMGDVTVRIGRALSDAAGGSRENRDPGAVFDELLTRLGIRVSLRDLGVRPDQITHLAGMVEGRVDVDPLHPTREDIVRLYSEAMV